MLMHNVSMCMCKYVYVYIHILTHIHGYNTYTPVLFCLPAVWHGLHGLLKREGTEAARVGHCITRAVYLVYWQ